MLLHDATARPHAAGAHNLPYDYSIEREVQRVTAGRWVWQMASNPAPAARSAYTSACGMPALGWKPSPTTCTHTHATSQAWCTTVWRHVAAFVGTAALGNVLRRVVCNLASKAAARSARTCGSGPSSLCRTSSSPRHRARSRSRRQGLGASCRRPAVPAPTPAYVHEWHIMIHTSCATECMADDSPFEPSCLRTCRCPAAALPHKPNQSARLPGQISAAPIEQMHASGVWNPCTAERAQLLE